MTSCCPPSSPSSRWRGCAMRSNARSCGASAPPCTQAATVCVQAIAVCVQAATLATVCISGCSRVILRCATQRCFDLDDDWDEDPDWEAPTAWPWTRETAALPCWRRGWPPRAASRGGRASGPGCATLSGEAAPPPRRPVSACGAAVSSAPVGPQAPRVPTNCSLTCLLTCLLTRRHGLCRSVRWSGVA